MDEKAFKELKEKLSDAVGKRIDEFCEASLADLHGENHCAHFVSHMLNYNISGTASCKTYTWDDKHNDQVVGASIRVNEIYTNITPAKKGPISNDACYRSGLVFVTEGRNIKVNGAMGTRKRKHIGIMIGQYIYHYGNTADKVKKQDLGSFISTFTQIYQGNGGVVFFRGDFI